MGGTFIEDLLKFRELDPRAELIVLNGKSTVLRMMRRSTPEVYELMAVQELGGPQLGIL